MSNITVIGYGGSNPGHEYIGREDLPGGGTGGTVAQPGDLRQCVALIGAKDGVNSVYSTPDNFVNDTDIKVRVYWNGRLMTETRDYTVSNVGGAPGFNRVAFSPWSTINKLPKSGDELCVDYYIAT